MEEWQIERGRAKAVMDNLEIEAKAMTGRRFRTELELSATRPQKAYAMQGSQTLMDDYNGFGITILENGNIIETVFVLAPKALPRSQANIQWFTRQMSPESIAGSIIIKKLEEQQLQKLSEQGLDESEAISTFWTLDQQTAQATVANIKVEMTIDSLDNTMEKAAERGKDLSALHPGANPQTRILSILVFHNGQISKDFLTSETPWGPLPQDIRAFTNMMTPTNVINIASNATEKLPRRKTPAGKLNKFSARPTAEEKRFP